MKLKEVRGTVDLNGNLNLHITFSGINGVTKICESLEVLNSFISGQPLSGALGFITLAGKIYESIKSGK